jgi:hypothetical protein
MRGLHGKLSFVSISLLEFLHFSCVASKGHMLGKDSGFAGLDYG